MTRLINDAQHFATESLKGFAAANATEVRLVPDAGVAAAVVPVAARVALVMGGGSGHYPAFLGWVGPGLADGAVSGNIFSSPSAAQVVRVAQEAAQGRPVLLLPINYAGDILHFSEARDRLRADGHDVRLVAVTDDIASASADDTAQRRGIAGSFLVAKVVGAAVQAGADIDDAERLAQKANAATRSLGLAFSGCTLPGSAGPNFEVPEGQMALGLGIHGEPGLRMLEMQSADHAADVLVDELFRERSPRHGERVAVLVNGLGATKYDELHVLFARIAHRIEASGMILVAPVIGELVTSLDMAGVSLSIGYLDDELEELWCAPAHSAAFTRTAPGAALAVSAAIAPAASAARKTPAPLAPASAASSIRAVQIATVLEAVASELAHRADELARLDSVAGDGDHGACMQRGSGAAHEAALTAVDRGAGAGSALVAAGDAWSDVGGGTSGALWGAGLRAAGERIGDEASGDATALRDAVETFIRTIVDRGGASVGDKTMLDAIAPFVDAFSAGIDSGDTPASAWHVAALAAQSAAEGTAEFAARRGRSRTHGDASVGTPDPGAVSFALIVAVVDKELGQFDLEGTDR